MKRFIILIIFIVLFDTASAQVMRQLNATIDVISEAETTVELVFRFTEQIKEINFPFSHDVINIETNGGSCVVEKDVEQIIRCKPPSPFMVGTITIQTRFNTRDMTKKQNNITQFLFDIPILWRVDEVRVLVKLPSGMVVSDDVVLPISPSGVSVGSDGRRITNSWKFNDINSGDVIPIRIYYEPLKPPPVTIVTQYIEYYRWIATLLIVVIIGIVLTYRRISKRSELVLSVLNEGERIIVDLLIQQGKKNVDQRKIVKLSGFSKAKVSRIITSLVERGVVDVQRIGRKNRITLKKKFVKD